MWKIQGCMVVLREMQWRSGHKQPPSLCYPSLNLGQSLTLKRGVKGVSKDHQSFMWEKAHASKTCRIHY
jgi:hypothetical protein